MLFGPFIVVFYKNYYMNLLFRYIIGALFLTQMFWLVSCGEQGAKKPKQIEPVKVDSLQLEKNTKEIKQELKKSNFSTEPPSSDTVSIDSVRIEADTLIDSAESHMQPIRKPTFRHFYKYMKLHKKGPTV